MSHIVFTPYIANPDVWMRESQKANGLSYWEYVLLYVDEFSTHIGGRDGEVFYGEAWLHWTS